LISLWSLLSLWFTALNVLRRRFPFRRGERVFLFVDSFVFLRYWMNIIRFLGNFPFVRRQVTDKLSRIFFLITFLWIRTTSNVTLIWGDFFLSVQWWEISDWVMSFLVGSHRQPAWLFVSLDLSTLSSKLFLLQLN
jgi:hypothetical protein